MLAAGACLAASAGHFRIEMPRDIWQLELEVAYCLLSNLGAF